ncbi:MAG: hypothetical protein COW32_01065 [Candidatus Aquicultor secundus]|uniref:Uncharacterized protein n=1 Tax=Candidatus Aquicultor secundus TaxID=1973895 RepID=A0A2M7T9I6_9ACTN|nr:hypothetical protein [Candidatus Aquicultor secundus]PIU27934.1 MAG: hypothetical protein COT10_00915 [Candidatus Aquicultor secundus]PIW23103.1 MAG: hypothetical protein COW32_01065 [Candidatus Aquicultor secundus]PIZ41219.1 MAG: hypothetical protein COY37_02650 [Candidatus Aquicultor secundus]
MTRNEVEAATSGVKPDYPRFAPEERRGVAKRKVQPKGRVVGVQSRIKKAVADLSPDVAWL